MASSKSITDRFWAKVDKGGPDECWPWTGNRLPKGYGQFKPFGLQRYAHRVSWALAHGTTPDGTIPGGMCVLHSCDNPPCVNPAHLFLGTKTDNMRDKVAKGRQAKGVDNGQAKLSEDDVQAIRASLGESRKEVARRFGVSAATVGDILCGRTWTTLPWPGHAPPPAR